MRNRLLGTGAAWIAAFVCMLVGALPPSIQPVYVDPHGAEALRAIGQHHVTWVLASSAFAVGMGLLLVGFALITSVLREQDPTSPLPEPAFALLIVGSAFWIAAQAFRVTTTLRVADVVIAGGAVPDWYPYLRSWADDGLLDAMTFTAGPAIVIFGVAVARRRVLAPWTGWAAALLAVAAMAEFFLTDAPVPATLYLAPVFMAVSALFQGRRSSSRDAGR